MPDSKISELPLASSFSGDELFPIVQDGSTVQAGTEALATYMRVNAVPFVTAPGSTVSRTLTERAADVVSVRDYGAVGDGVTDNTTALQAAITAAAAINGRVYVPSGLYLTGPLTVPTGKSIALIGETVVIDPNSAVDATRGAMLQLKNGSNASLLTFEPTAAPSLIQDLGLHGNQAGQTSGTSFGVHLPAGSGSLDRAIKLERVRIDRCRSGAVCAEAARDAGDIIDCTFSTCGFNSDGTAVASFGDGLLIGACNDWRVDMLDTGGHTRNGIYATGAQNLVMYSTMSYSNRQRGLRVDASAGLVRAVGCMFDRNVMDGVLFTGSGSAARSVARVLLNCAFSANNFSGTTGVYSDVRADDCPLASDPVQIIACTFTDSGATANNVKYHVDAQGTTTGVVFLAPMYRTDAGKGYVTEAVSDRTKIIEVDGPVSRNAFRVATSTSDINWLQIQGGTASDGKVIITADGSDTNIPLSLRPKGNSPVYLRSTAPRLLMINTSGAANETRAYQDLSGALLRFSLMSDDEASATRWMEVGRSGTTVSYISLGGAFAAEALRVTPVASQVNRVEVTGSATGTAVTVSAGGADTNLDLKLIPKGTGKVQVTGPLETTGAISAAGATFTGAVAMTLTNAADDAAAATAGVPVGALYRSGSTLMVRVA